jgi:glycosyltransferase involved in cell wall biosynthesis
VPPITVITINRNTGMTARETVDSLRGQSEPFNWVVIDGASTDGSQEILRAGLRSGDTLLSEPDGGIADAFNKGIRCASGQVLLFLNAGDALADGNALSRLVSKWAGGQVPWVTGGACVCAESGIKLYDRNHSTDVNAIRLLQHGCRIWHAATLVDKTLFQRFGLYDTSYRIAMDYEFWLRLMGGGIPLGVVPEVICRFRIGGVSQQVLKRLREERKARAAHGAMNSNLVEMHLGLLHQAKRLLTPIATPGLYRLKERLGW